ncbi:uncharacterized protein LOC133896406 [Phragmites australis]|uniref:uncharacterized protein LOC133896406 n=1 Tax=Phragmites australis TaxID=29695 RepID=UPI002D791CA7|nr:uncharacterized protein LOC133896406 [Phragmites australis]
METCSRAGTLSSLWPWGLAIHPRDLWYLFFRVLPKLLVFPHSLLKKFRKDEHVHASLMKLDTVVGVMPELPQDMLMVIFANLQIPDLIRAGSVSSSWHAAYTSLRDLGQYKKSQTPCLLYTSESAGENVACLYSLVEQREYKLTLPEPPIRSRFPIGSSNGWLITADERSELHLVNPITGEQIALPSVITIKQVKPIFDDSGTINMYELSYHSGRAPEIYALNDLREHLYFKAFVFPDLSTGSYIVVLIHNPYQQLSFARAGDDKWNLLLPNTRYRDCMCMDGLLYALTSLGEIHAYDLTASTVTMKVIMDRVKFIHESMYIIPAPWGDLLQVWRIVDHPMHVEQDAPGIVYHPGQEVWRIVNHPEHEEEDGDVLGILNHPDQEDEDGDAPGIVNAPEQEDERVRYITKKIIVYKVDMAAKELVKINSLPHHMLFLGHNQTLCLGAAEHPQLKANHAYFTDDHDELIMLLKNHTRDIGVLNLENSRRKEIVSQICSNWPCPTWIIPNLAKMNLAFSK